MLFLAFNNMLTRKCRSIAPFFILIYLSLSHYIIPLCSAGRYPSLVNSALRVPTAQGEVQGQTWDFDGYKGAIFKGLRYAQPPVGDLRFKKPQQLKNFTKLYEADRYRPACIQFAENSPMEAEVEAVKMQSEDCLYLNIFAPVKGNNNPVLVWIHGGSFATGSGAVNVDDDVVVKRIVSRGVILVTINYRLGIYGFTVGPKIEDSNFGIWDQVEALKWINLNIAAFGGDKKRVTVMGESAGGASASILALAEPTRELVSHAIIMSGSVAASWAAVEPSRSSYKFHHIQEFLSCRTKINKDNKTCNLIPDGIDTKCKRGTDEAAWNCFRDKAVAFGMPELTVLRQTLTMEFLPLLAPIIDGVLIPGNASHMLKTMPRMPIMTGIAADEWAKRKMTVENSAYRDDYTEEERLNYLESMVASQYPRLKPDRGSVAAHYQYVDINQNGTKDHLDTKQFANMMRRVERDIHFIAPTALEVDAYADRNQDVFLYTFAHSPGDGITRLEKSKMGIMGIPSPVSKIKIPVVKPFHGLDHAYIFTKGKGDDFTFDYDKNDEIISDAFVSYITNFVKTGNPNPEPKRPDLSNWPVYTKKEPYHMRIDRYPQSQLGGFFWPATSFWNSYMPKLMSERTPRISREAGPAAHRDNERSQLAAYKQSWLALWILVGVIMAVLWTVIIVLLVRRCMTTKTRTHGPVTKVYRSV